MTYNLRHFFKEFKPYLGDRRVVIKGLYNGIPVTVERSLSLVGFEPRTATIKGASA